MSQEGRLIDCKPLRFVTRNIANFIEIAKDCVAIANSQGGSLQIGIEDGELMPPSSQCINPALLDVIRKRILVCM